MDPSPDVIHEAIAAALEALADAELDGSERDIEAAEERLARYQAVVVRHNVKEDDQTDDDFEGGEDDWIDLGWDDEDGSHGA